MARVKLLEIHKNDTWFNSKDHLLFETFKGEILPLEEDLQKAFGVGDGYVSFFGRQQTGMSIPMHESIPYFFQFVKVEEIPIKK